MNNKVKKLWIEALRSGKYEQGHCALRNEHNKFCCLGVLTDLYIKENNLEWGPQNHNKNYSFGYSGGTGYLHEYVAKWAGIDGDDIQIDGSSASRLNDRYGLSFAQIANLIEAHL